MNPPRYPACDLPDLPRWVEARAAVLSGECDIFGMPDESACIIRSTRLPLATVIGKPSTELLLRSVDIVGCEVELLVMPEDASHVRKVLGYWRELPVTLHTRKSEPPLPAHADRSIRIYDPWDLRGKRGFPAEIKNALRAARIVAAKRIDGHVVAVCHTDAITEQWWDVGVDTAEDHRRNGHATACFAALDAYMHKRGKRPVWGALDANTASMTMAASLGFKPVDRLCMFLSPNRKTS